MKQLKKKTSQIGIGLPIINKAKILKKKKFQTKIIEAEHENKNKSLYITKIHSIMYVCEKFLSLGFIIFASTRDFTEG